MDERLIQSLMENNFFKKYKSTLPKYVRNIFQLFNKETSIKNILIYLQNENVLPTKSDKSVWNEKNLRNQFNLKNYVYLTNYLPVYLSNYLTIYLTIYLLFSYLIIYLQTKCHSIYFSIFHFSLAKYIFLYETQ